MHFWGGRDGESEGRRGGEEHRGRGDGRFCETNTAKRVGGRDGEGARGAEKKERERNEECRSRRKEHPLYASHAASGSSVFTAPSQRGERRGGEAAGVRVLGWRSGK